MSDEEIVILIFTGIRHNHIQDVSSIRNLFQENKTGGTHCLIRDDVFLESMQILTA